MATPAANFNKGKQLMEPFELNCDFVCTPKEVYGENYDISHLPVPGYKVTGFRTPAAGELYLDHGARVRVCKPTKPAPGFFYPRFILEKKIKRRVILFAEIDRRAPNLGEYFEASDGSGEILRATTKAHHKKAIRPIYRREVTEIEE